jgi:quinol monooxygenase YgiN
VNIANSGFNFIQHKLIKTKNKMQLIPIKQLTVLVSLLLLTFSFNNKAMAQDKNQMVRLVNIKVDPLQLDQYNIALKEQMTTAVRVEPGVLTYYAVADKDDPSKISILEIYANKDAYNSHIETVHFKKYKETVKNMVKSLELIDVSLIGSAKKSGL